MTCKMLCLIKGQSGFVSLAAYPISAVVPLDLSSTLVHHHAPASIVCEKHLARLFNVQQVAMHLPV